MTLRGHENWVMDAAFSPDGKRIATASWDRTARVWDAATGKEITTFRGHADVVRAAAFSPDGAHVITASRDKTVRIWDASTGQEIMVLRGHNAEVTSAAFTPDGTRIVTASLDRTARLWDAKTGKEILELRGHEDGLSWAALSPDGARVVTASQDGTARIWDAATAQEIAVLGSGNGPVLFAAFLPDGAKVVTASRDKTARIWNAQLPATSVPDLIVEACRHRLGRLSISPTTTRCWPGCRTIRARSIRATGSTDTNTSVSSSAKAEHDSRCSALCQTFSKHYSRAMSTSASQPTPPSEHGVKAAPGRSCGNCSLCCKLLSIPELEKPEATWCTHCKPGQGCSAYQQRPTSCRVFGCSWLIDGHIEDIWYPRRSKMVLHAVQNIYGKPPVLLKVLVDRDFPNAWQKEPYYSKIKHLALNGLKSNSYHLRVIISGTKRELLILPDRDIEDPPTGIVKRVSETRWEFVPTASDQEAAAAVNAQHRG